MSVRTLPPRVLALIEEVAERHGFPVDALLAPARGQRLHGDARQEAMLAIRNSITICGAAPSYSRIAKWFGLSDHTSVMNACRNAARKTGADVRARSPHPEDALAERSTA